MIALKHIDEEMQTLQEVLAVLVVECKKAPKANIERVEERAKELPPEILALLHHMVLVNIGRFATENIVEVEVGPEE